MDWMTIAIFVGFFLTGIIAGIPIGQAFERRRLEKMHWVKRAAREYQSRQRAADKILNAKEIS